MSSNSNHSNQQSNIENNVDDRNTHEHTTTSIMTKQRHRHTTTATTTVLHQSPSSKTPTTQVKKQVSITTTDSKKWHLTRTPELRNQRPFQQPIPKSFFSDMQKERERERDQHWTRSRPRCLKSVFSTHGFQKFVQIFSLLTRSIAWDSTVVCQSYGCMFSTGTRPFKFLFINLLLANNTAHGVRVLGY